MTTTIFNKHLKKLAKINAMPLTHEIKVLVGGTSVTED